MRESVELFHLLFLLQLASRLDHRVYALKGGCNLRFFFGSIRYSEDLDLDVDKLAVGTLKKKVLGLLEGRPLAVSARAFDIEVAAVTAPKQTETTQRFKVVLSTPQGQVNTKVEFSRRGLDPGHRLERADRALISHYRLQPLLLNHYDRQTAFEQKVRALAGRTTPQARDVFDLDLLADSSLDLQSLPGDLRERAADRALEIDRATFLSQVVTFLPPEQHSVYQDASVWDDLCLGVAALLRGQQI